MQPSRSHHVVYTCTCIYTSTFTCQKYQYFYYKIPTFIAQRWMFEVSCRKWIILLLLLVLHITHALYWVNAVLRHLLWTAKHRANGSLSLECSAPATCCQVQASTSGTAEALTLFICLYSTPSFLPWLQDSWACFKCEINRGLGWNILAYST